MLNLIKTRSVSKWQLCSPGSGRYTSSATYVAGHVSASTFGNELLRVEIFGDSGMSGSPGANSYGDGIGLSRRHFVGARANSPPVRRNSAATIDHSSDPLC